MPFQANQVESIAAATCAVLGCNHFKLMSYFLWETQHGRASTRTGQYALHLGHSD